MSQSATPTTAPTVVYDTERLPTSTDSLAPPDLDAIMQRRHPWRRLLHLEFPRSVQLPLTCLSIGLSALQANGVYCWPTYGPVIGRMLELNGAQTQTIVVGGILGVYLCAAPLGALTDRYGPRIASLVSALLSSLGYIAFSRLLVLSDPGTPYIHLYLTACYFAVGAATVGSYFAALTCASLSFPAYPTLSLSIPLSLIGLSSLVLSSFSTLPTFLTPEHDLNAPKFLIFLGILSPAINLFSALFLRVVPPSPIKLVEDMDDEEEDQYNDDLALSQSLHLDEHTPLLIGGLEAARRDVEDEEQGKEIRWTVVGLVKDYKGFWTFGLLLALCIGPAETIIASIGSVLTSLLPPETSIVFTSFIAYISPTITTLSSNPLALRNKHVRILSLTSTTARLLTGLTADYLCPAPTAIPAPDSDDINAPSHLFVQKKPIRLYRSMYAAICSLILGAVFTFGAAVLTSERGLWVFSGGVGLMYGALFTLTPAIVSAHFGATNFGLAWGMISYFPALGSVIFSYLYALLSQAHVDQDTHSAGRTEEPAFCYGPECFRATFWISAACCLVASVGLGILGRRWRV
ncbi:major facilitator superfamily domain-containing protein [Naematelia encephala]|uniref:Major facilitator superfamily domain-containing protein n=1 Tax=Naematelia encephala TaxID=71784 RepID=A0A1Y2AV92_9TREE|nr:major facilitator superfamily domain-containing protein [Naematelia encephala]